MSMGALNPDSGGGDWQCLFFGGGKKSHDMKGKKEKKEKIKRGSIKQKRFRREEGRRGKSSITLPNGIVTGGEKKKSH